MSQQPRNTKINAMIARQLQKMKLHSLSSFVIMQIERGNVPSFFKCLWRMTSLFNSQPMSASSGSQTASSSVRFSSFSRLFFLAFCNVSFVSVCSLQSKWLQPKKTRRKKRSTNNHNYLILFQFSNIFSFSFLFLLFLFLFFLFPSLSRSLLFCSLPIRRKEKQLRQLYF